MSTFEIIGICMILSSLYIAFEMWRAPMLEERPDGSFKTIRPAKKLSDLFKKKK
jgi:hypothetical protein